jgi:hypothetical protein
MSRNLLDALARAEQHLARLNSVESILDAKRIARASGVEVPREVADDAAFVVASILQDQRADGSWMGSLLYTSHMLDVARELGAERSVAIDRAIEWIHARSVRGADPDCGYVFEAAPHGVDLSSLALPGGYPIGTDAEVRFSVSCLAAMALAEFGDRNADVERQVELAADHVNAGGRTEPRLTPFLCATRLLCAAGSPAGSSALAIIARLQRGDGTWRGVDLFLVLDTMAYAYEKGIAAAVVETAMRNAASTLFVMQQRDGSWGRQTGPIQTLAGLSALRALVHRDVSAIPI